MPDDNGWSDRILFLCLDGDARFYMWPAAVEEAGKSPLSTNHCYTRDRYPPTLFDHLHSAARLGVIHLSRLSLVSPPSLTISFVDEHAMGCPGEGEVDLRPVRLPPFVLAWGLANLF